MSRKKVSNSTRKKVYQRAVDHCEYCQCPKSHSNAVFTIDHIHPISKDGTEELINLALACMTCNQCKSNIIEAMDKLTNKTSILFNPRIHKWAEHFEWSADALLIIGITAIGRVTVEKLKLNRPELVNLRTLWKIARIHPPKHTLPNE